MLTSNFKDNQIYPYSSLACAIKIISCNRLVRLSLTKPYKLDISKR
jgi:hypothetical protein